MELAGCLPILVKYPFQLVECPFILAGGWLNKRNVDKIIGVSLPISGISIKLVEC